MRDIYFKHTKHIFVCILVFIRKLHWTIDDIRPFVSLNLISVTKTLLMQNIRFRKLKSLVN